MPRSGELTSMQMRDLEIEVGRAIRGTAGFLGETNGAVVNRLAHLRDAVADAATGKKPVEPATLLALLERFGLDKAQRAE